jgi:DNA replication licensing factor MCM4
VAENIALPPTLLTRFDLIYLLLDSFDEAKDLQLARHLISMYHEGATGAARAAADVVRASCTWHHWMGGELAVLLFLLP